MGGTDAVGVLDGKAVDDEALGRRREGGGDADDAGVGVYAQIGVVCGEGGEGGDTAGGGDGEDGEVGDAGADDDGVEGAGIGDARLVDDVVAVAVVDIDDIGDSSGSVVLVDALGDRGVIVSVVGWLGDADIVVVLEGEAEVGAGAQGGDGDGVGVGQDIDVVEGGDGGGDGGGGDRVVGAGAESDIDMDDGVDLAADDGVADDFGWGEFLRAEGDDGLAARRVGDVTRGAGVADDEGGFAGVAVVAAGEGIFGRFGGEGVVVGVVTRLVGTA